MIEYFDISIANAFLQTVGGFRLWLAAIAAGVAFCLAIIGFPFDFRCLKIVKVSFAPLGKKVVRK